ncbi:MAG TPA: hypothetical protein VIW07_13095 [Candidatus Udaeobacter sp.]|jgi:hypothetical protein
MKMCMNHWTALKKAISTRGLMDFVAGSGEKCVKRQAAQFRSATITKETYDPLMAAYWAIAGNAMDLLQRNGMNALVMMTEQPGHPEWECPICYLNWVSAEHDRTCTEPTCTKPKGQTFDDWINKAADGQAEFVKSL